MAGMMKAGAMALAMLAIAPTTAAVAADVIDQRQEKITLFNRYSGGVPTQSWQLTQTFQPEATTLSGVGLRFNLFGIEPLTEVDWLALNVSRGAEILTPATVTLSIDADGWVTGFWVPFAVVPDETYTITFSIFGGSQSPPYALYISANDDYARGRLTDTFFFIDENDAWKTASDVYSGDGKFDAVFRTYAQGAAAAVPEPASWALFIAGFGFAGAVLRRRKRQMAVCI